MNDKQGISAVCALFDNQAVRFIFVGGLNTLFGYALFALLIFMGLNYAYAMLLTTCIGMLFNFKSTGKWVFNSSDNRLFFKFIALYGCLYVFNITLIYGLDFFFHNPYISGIFSIFICALLSYFGNKNFIFTVNKSMLAPPSQGGQEEVKL